MTSVEYYDKQIERCERLQKRCGELASIRYDLLDYIIQNKMATNEQFNELMKIAFPE